MFARLPFTWAIHHSTTAPSSAQQDTVTRLEPPATPPRTHASNAHARNGSVTLTPPVLYVTPSGDQDASATNAANTASRQGHSPSASLDSTTNGNTNYYPPSPTLSVGSNNGNNGNTLNSSARISPSSPSSRTKGHSPTKSEDSHFYQFLEESSRRQQRARGDTVNSSTGTGSTTGGDVAGGAAAAGGHKRRPSNTSGLSATTASENGGAAAASFNGKNGQQGNGDLEANLTSVATADKEHAVDSSEEPKTVKTGFLAKVPFFNRFAKTTTAEPKKVVLQDPTPQEMGVFGPMVPSSLNALLDPKSLPNLQAMGGDKGLVEKLFSNAETGLSEKDLQAGATIEDRKRVYGENKLPQRKSKSLLQLMWIAYQDKLLVGATFSYAQVSHFGANLLFFRSCSSSSPSLLSLLSLLVSINPSVVNLKLTSHPNAPTIYARSNR